MKIRLFACVVGFGFCFVSSASENFLKLSISVPSEIDWKFASNVVRTQDSWISLIQSARTEICLGQFYLSRKAGQGLDPVLGELDKARARGVKVRLMVSNALMNEDAESLKEFCKNSDCRILNLSKRGGGIIHSKYWVVDGERFYTGSANLDWRALDHIFEFGVFGENAAVAQGLKEIFESDWKLASSYLDESSPLIPLAQNANPSFVDEKATLTASPKHLNPQGIAETLPELVKFLGSAKKTLKIHVLNYDTFKGSWVVLDSALKTLGKNGVKVQILFSDWQLRGSKTQDMRSLAGSPGISVKIVKFPEHSSGPIPYARVSHSKFMVVDGRVLLVSSSNWSKDYFENSRNVEVFLNDAKLAALAESIFDGIWDSKEAVDATENAGENVVRVTDSLETKCNWSNPMAPVLEASFVMKGEGVNFPAIQHGVEFQVEARADGTSLVKAVSTPTITLEEIRLFGLKKLSAMKSRDLELALQPWTGRGLVKGKPSLCLLD